VGGFQTHRPAPPTRCYGRSLRTSGTAAYLLLCRICGVRRLDERFVLSLAWFSVDKHVLILWLVSVSRDFVMSPNTNKLDDDRNEFALPLAKVEQIDVMPGV